MKGQGTFIDFVLKEWLLIVSGASLLLTSIYTRHFPTYSRQEFQVLFLLFLLFVVVNGLRNSGFILKIAQNIEKGKVISLKLIAATFFLSMFVTNDVALIIMVPLTLSFRINRKDILVIFEALAANAGSALTPFGNPQNLFIYWFYGIHPITFIEKIAPFSFSLLVILTITAVFIKTGICSESSPQKQIVSKTVYVYGVSFLAVLLIIFRVAPVATGFFIIAGVLLFDRKSLHIDYAILFTFFFLFGFAENIKTLVATGIQHPQHIFLLSVLASQIMSNVPAALLLAKFTTNWKALLWGTNVGGFGSLFGSFANLIAYKIYVNHEKANGVAPFTIKFITINYLAFFLSVGLYFFFAR